MFQPGRHFLRLSTLLVLGMLLLPHLSSAQVSSSDPNFTPSILKSGLSFPDGVVFRPPTGDLLVTQSGNNQVSAVNANSGMIHSFATTSPSPDKIADRSSDGLVAVMTGTFGPVAFFSSNGTSQGTADLGAAIMAAFPGPFSGTTVACLSGLSFDTSGNLFVAAGPGSTEVNGCTPGNWAIYEFAGPMPETARPTRVTTFDASAVIQDMVFSAARPPFGTLYAIDSQFGFVYEISLTPCGAGCSIFPSQIATVSSDSNPRGIAVDPLLGDIYVTEFQGTQILKIPAPGAPSDPSPIIFATGFSSNETGDTLRLAFDSNGNLYVNEFTAGNLWKFTRASNATTQQPLIPGKINTFTFTNPNPAMSDQIQTILIPASANLNGAAFIQDIFVSVDPTTLDTTLANGTTGDTAFFGGAPVPARTTCALVPSAASPGHPNCVVVVQKCYDANHNPFEICPVQEPSTGTDLIQLTFTYSGAQLLSNPAFLIGFDNGDGQDITDITIADCCSGGTKSLCSKTFDASLPANSGDFSLAISPDPLDLTVSNPASATVTVTSLNSFTSTIGLVVSDVPAGFTASLTPTSVTLGTTAMSTLTVGISSSATTSGMATIIANLLAAGCIDNAGIANALTSKLSTAQTNIGAGHIQTAINVLMAFRDQVQAQSGKHVASSCTTTFPLIVEGTASNSEVRLASENITFTPATVITANVVGLITSLKASVSSADPITGFVMDSTGNGVQNVTVTILNPPANTPVPGATAMTDVTGFYFFATTGSLGVGSSYIVQVTVPAPFSTASPTYPPFSWAGKGLAFNFTLQ
jgi:hypothetical protein